MTNIIDKETQRATNWWTRVKDNPEIITKRAEMAKALNNPLLFSLNPSTIEVPMYRATVTAVVFMKKPTL
jgi:hypothetical protein